MTPNENAHPISKRISESMFQYLSRDAWTTLFYQILKVFYVSKVSYKKYQLLTTIPSNLLKFPPEYLEQSPVYSKEEITLFRWAEVSQILEKNVEKRLSSFDRDFQDGYLYASLIQQYSANSYKPYATMKTVCMSEDDVVKNMRVIHSTMEEMGIANIPSLNEMTKPSPRETI